MNGKGRAISILMAIFLMIGALTGCQTEETKTETGSDKEAIKIAVICDAAGQNDNGYNQSAVKGAEKAAADLGAEYKIVEPTTGVPAALETLAEDGYDIIFNLVYDFEALIQGVGGAKPIAETYPDTTFVIFNDNPNLAEDGSTLHDNVISVLFDVHEASYLAGALATQVNEHSSLLFPADKYEFTAPDAGGRAIGFVGGTNSNGITVFSYGFIEGINYVAAELEVEYEYYAKYDAGFADPATGSSIAGTFYNQGANVVYSVAGGVGDGVASKAAEEKKLAIQVDANKDAQQPGYILTSVIKNTEVPVYELTKAGTEGNLGEQDNLLTFSLGTGATTITDLAEISKHIADTDEAREKWEEIKAYVEDIEQKITSGEIKVTNAQIGEELDSSAVANVVIK